MFHIIVLLFTYLYCVCLCCVLYLVLCVFCTCGPCTVVVGSFWSNKLKSAYVGEFIVLRKSVEVIIFLCRRQASDSINSDQISFI